MNLYHWVQAVIALALIAGCASHIPDNNATTAAGSSAPTYSPVNVATFLTLSPTERIERAEASDRSLLVWLSWKAHCAHQRDRELPEEISKELVRSQIQLDRTMDLVLEIVERLNERTNVGPKPDDRFLHLLAAASRMGGPIDWSSSAGRGEDLLQALDRAVSCDPTNTMAWYGLADLLGAAGDRRGSLRASTMAEDAGVSDHRDYDPSSTLALTRLHAAWMCRDLGYWEEGLNWMDRLGHEASESIALEARIVEGLLHAGAGRFQTASDIARDIGTVEYGHAGWWRLGLGTIASAYVQNWIDAMAWVGIGDSVSARHALGTLLPTRVDVPFMERYWNDVGLVLELSGDTAGAKDAYGLTIWGFRHMVRFIPWEGVSCPPIILDQPSTEVPCFVVYDDQLVSGSLFTYATRMLIETAQAPTIDIRRQKGARAMEAWNICLRRQIRPTLSLAMRGRTRYHMGDISGAEEDLVHAQQALARLGQHDPSSGLILGSVLVLNDHPHDAIPHLRRAVQDFPEAGDAWRSLGSALALAGSLDESLKALDQAIRLDPVSAGSWWNRGLLHAESERWDSALCDLTVAMGLGYGGDELNETLDVAEQHVIESSGDDGLALIASRAERLLSTIAHSEH